MSSVPVSTGRPERGASASVTVWALTALVVMLHLFAPVTGQSGSAAPTAWLGVAATLLAVGQGLPLVWRRSHPIAVVVCVLACYAGTAVVVGLVPPFAGWVLVWSIGSSLDERRGSVRLAAVTASGTGLLVLLAELTRPGVGASALLLLITLVVALAAVLLRTERGRVDAVRQRAATQERLRIARDLHDLVGHG